MKNNEVIYLTIFQTFSLINVIQLIGSAYASKATGGIIVESP
ncbi:hypothetical protein UF72_2681 [Staphylococcus equorum subsp. equorum]|nr:hypothetical protein UF72_2681 [Staphylococcus equorum subsp. equorum]